jgi:prevent-host-death family protein
MIKRIAVTDLRRNFPAILDQADRGRARFLITRYGVPMAVLLGIADLKDILKKQLKAGAIHRAERDRQLAEEWMSLEDEDLIRRGE